MGDWEGNNYFIWFFKDLEILEGSQLRLALGFLTLFQVLIMVSFSSLVLTN